MNEITRDLLRRMFDYRDGYMYWKVSATNRVKVGDRAGSVQKTGYQTIGIDGKIHLAHRLVFLYHNGTVPAHIDHIDGNKLNNRINNLRGATTSQNAMNRNSNKLSSSVYKGVSWNKPTKKWMAQITVDYKSKNLGRFINEMDAAKAYNDAAIEMFGEFARINDIGDI